MYSYSKGSVVSVSLREVLVSVGRIYLQVLLFFKEASNVKGCWLCYRTLCSLIVDLQFLWIASLVM